ncbi:MAG: hypothetical protein H7Y13_06605 [Sphingobacteriaceae bacterium]|nr:hypothetical protein [Sphingobacteriaceae bacterium]
MLHKAYSLLFFCFILTFTSSAQNTDSLISPKIQLTFPLIDAPYIGYATRTVNNGQPTAGAILRGYANPSMQQSLALTADLYTAVHYGIQRGVAKYRRIDNEKRWHKKFFNSSIHYLADFVLTYSPLGGGWLHEEYHRGVMTLGKVNSFNGMNKFPIGASTVAVSHVADEDLVRFKASDSKSFIRMQVAGIEGEYLLVDRLQRNNFFYRQSLMFESQYVLTTLNSALYVLVCSQPKIANVETDKMNQKEAEVKVRDFTGLDFNGWAYDLFRPNEPYEARGVHPSGNGIDRYRTTRHLTPDQLTYLNKQGKLQFLNFLSPMMFGVRSLRIGQTGWNGNFAVRHLLTSFGNDISLQVYLMNTQHRAALTYHRYKNFEKGYSAIEGSMIDVPLSLSSKKNLLFTPRVIVGMQPRNQDFMTKRADFLGLVGTRVDLVSKSSKWSPYIDVDAKTSGWVAGNEFLGPRLAGRFGLAVRINN